MKIYWIFLGLFFSTAVYSQTNQTTKIDIELQKCLRKPENYSTLGMIKCVHKATVKWDKKLNETYRKLLSLLTTTQKLKLKSSQREWLKFRDKEIEFSNQLYYDLQGTMWRPIAAETKLKLTKNRTLMLQEYLLNLTNAN